MELPLSLRAATSGAGESGLLGSAISAAKTFVDEIGPRFRIKTPTAVRETVPADLERMQKIAKALSLGDVSDVGITKVVDAQGYGVVGFSQIWPGWTKATGVHRGELALIGVLPEFRNASKSLLDAMRRDMAGMTEPWFANARDDTAGRIINRFEQQGLIDVKTRLHHDNSPLGSTGYEFGINSEAEAAKARQTIAASIHVRPAVKEDEDKVRAISEKYGLTWTPYLTHLTTVAEADEQRVVGFAYPDLRRNQLRDFAILPQFPQAATPLIKDVSARMNEPLEPIHIIGHPSTTGRLLQQLDKEGTIKIKSTFAGSGKSFYDFVVPKPAG
jgi:hypothetical protein